MFSKNNICIQPKALVLSVILVMSGCATVNIGQDFDVEAFENNAKINITTKAEVRKLLGGPEGTGVAVESDGESLEEWLYFSGTGSLPTMTDTTIKILQIRFDRAGIMKSYNWSYTK